MKLSRQSLNIKFSYLAENSKFSRSNSYFSILTPTFLRDGFLNSCFQNPNENSENVFISSVSPLSFLFLFLPCPSLSSLLLSLLSPFSLSLGDDTKWPTRVDVSLNPNTVKSSGRTRAHGPYKCQTNYEQYKHSLLSRTLREWNALPPNLVQAAHRQILSRLFMF